MRIRTTRFIKFSLTLLIVIFNATAGWADNKAASPESRILDFDTAARRVLESSLILNQEWNTTQSKKGLVKQAGLYPNPFFAYDLETSQRSWREREDSYALSQLVQLGGKRQKQIKVAQFDYYAALIGYEVSTLEQLNHVSKAFIRVAAAQELAQLALQNQKNAQEGLRLINAKLEAGKATLIQQNKARVAQTFADLNVSKSIAEFRTAKNSLALLWSSHCPDFDIVNYPFFETAEPIALEEYLDKLCDQPEIAQSLYRHMAAYHNLRLEKAARIPDITLTLGYGYDQGNKGVVAGFSAPLPIWNRNQGNIKRAQYEMLKVEDEGKQLRLFLTTKLSNAYLELKRVFQEIEDLKNLVLEISNQSLALAQEGYREGKLEYWEVLSSQQFFLEVQEKYIQALANYHTRRAEIDYLTSSP